MVLCIFSYSQCFAQFRMYDFVVYLLHIDYVKGFGGKFGVQTDRQDKSALGWDHQEKLQLHESQKGTPRPASTVWKRLALLQVSATSSSASSSFVRFHPATVVCRK